MLSQKKSWLIRKTHRYLGFSLLACDWLPLLALFLFILFIWIPNMAKKDRSLSKYPEFESYKKRTNKFFPFIY